MSALLITGADLAGSGRQDLLIEDGVITEVGALRSASGADVLDADGLVALPGLVDLHTHLREPGREDAETIASGSAAAAVGGFTAVLAMANTSPVTDTAEAAERVLDLGRAGGLVDVQPVGRGQQGPGRRGARRARADGPLAGAGQGLLRRRQVRDRLPAHAPRAGVRPRLRGRRLPARPGPAPGRPRCLLPRGRAVGPAGPARVAGHRRGDHRRPRRHAGAAHRLAGAHRPRLHRRQRGGHPLGQAAGHRRHRRGDPAPPGPHHRPASRATTPRSR